MVNTRVRVSELLFFYSYLKASIGSSFAAFAAGNMPDNKPTTTQRATPERIHIHGIINDPLVNIEVMFPTATPSMMPEKPPS